MSFDTSSGNVEAEETLEYQLVIKSRCICERRVSRLEEIAGEGGYRGGGGGRGGRGAEGARVNLLAVVSADQRAGLVKASEGRERRVSEELRSVGSVVRRRRKSTPRAEIVIPAKKAQTINRKLGNEVVAA